MTAVFELEQRVYVEDTDCYGVVYHANYLKYFERARTHWLIAHGLSLSEYRGNNVLFVIKDVQLQYHRPLYLNDRFVVTALPRIGSRSSLVFEQSLFLADNKEQVITTASLTLVAVNQQHRVVKVPAEIALILDG